MTQEMLTDITAPEERRKPGLKTIEDEAGLARMQNSTTARIGVGKCGPRLRTKTMLVLRADHAAARDSVWKEVPEELPEKLGLFTVETTCRSREEYLRRPDMGRVFSKETLQEISDKCVHHVDVQVYAADGLSSSAITANLSDILPVIMDALHQKNLSVGTPFFVKNSRVATMDHISERLDAKVTCVLLGERPGLASAESMSAYIAYRATVGMEESRRTVVSNIHARGIPPVEAGAYIADVIEMMLQQKVSGVELKK